MKAKLKNNKLFIFSIIFFLNFFIVLGTILIPKLTKNNSNNSIDPSYKEVKIEEPTKPSGPTIEPSLTLEIGSELPTITSYFPNQELSQEYTIKYYLNNQEISLEDFTSTKDTLYYLNSIDDYQVIVTIGDKDYVSELNVVDTTKPAVTLKSLTITEGDKYTIKQFLDSYNDNSGSSSYTISYVDMTDSKYTTPGTYDIEIKVCDLYKNCIEQIAKLTVNKFILTKVKTITQEVVIKTEVVKYGVKKITSADITYDVYNDGSKKEIKRVNERSKIDQTTFNGTVNDMKEEGISTYNTLGTTRNTILSLTNSYRTELNINGLQVDKTLSIMATIRAMEMAYSGEFSHERPDGRDWSTMWSDYLGSMPSSAILGENLAYGYASDEDACEGWKNSPKHYANMTNPDFTKIGIGKFTFNGETYWVQLFQG